MAAATTADSVDTEWNSYVDAYLLQVLPGKSEVQNLCQVIQNNEVKFYMIVEYMKKSLTSTSADDRCKGTRLLADLVHTLPKNLLLVKELEFITAFFCDRLKDHHSVVPHVLYGLLGLCKCENIGDSDTIKLLQAIFQEVHTQSHVHTDRRNVFTLFAVLLEKKMDCIKNILGVNFVFGYIQAIDGEKDPRNLLIIFNTLPVIINYLPLGEMTEDLFEVISCYFPVDFQPPPNNPFGITREDLEDGLRKCMTASPKFTEFCLPLLQEKLESDIKEAKLDALRLLKDCAEKYGVESMSTFFSALWTILRKQFFSARSKDIESSVLDSLFSLSKCASQDEGNDVFEPFVSTILKECKHHIIDNDDILRHGGAKLLETVAGGISTRCSRIIDVVLPLLFQHYGKQSVNVKRDFLNFMTSLMSILSKNSEEKVGDEQLAVIGEIYHLMLSEASCNSEIIRTASVSGLSLSENSDFVSREASLKTVKCALSMSLNEDNDSVREEVMKLLKVLAQHHPHSTEDIIIPELCKILEDRIELSESVAAYVIRSHESAVAISSSLSLVLPYIKTLMKVIKNLSYSNNMQAVDLLVESLSCMEKILRNIASVNNSCMETLCKEILFVVIELTVSCAIDNSIDCILDHSKLLVLFASVVQVIVQALDERLASEVMETCVKLFNNGAYSTHLPSLTADNIKDFNPLDTSSSSKKAHLVLILEAVIGCAVRESTLKMFANEHDEFLIKLLTLGCSCESATTRESASRCVAAILNKMTPGENMEMLFNSLTSILDKRLMDNSVNLRMYALQSWIWLCKASVLAAFSNMQELTNKLFELLTDSELGAQAADGFLTIVDNCKEVLNKASHAQIKIMYRQRFFMETSDRLLKGLKESHEEFKPNFLKALTHQIKFLPQQVLLSEAQKLIPVLAQSFSLQNAPLIESSLQTTILFMEKYPQAFSSQIQNLIPRLLQLTQFKGNMVVRKSALHCLKAITVQPNYLILPHKKDVIKSLSKCINDHKRLVRQAAAQARCDWYLVGSPTGS